MTGSTLSWPQHGTFIVIAQFFRRFLFLEFTMQYIIILRLGTILAIPDLYSFFTFEICVASPCSVQFFYFSAYGPVWGLVFLRAEVEVFIGTILG